MSGLLLRSIDEESHDRENSTNIICGTTAQYAYDMYRAKMEQIDHLKYECELLQDKYFSEMRRSNIPFVLRQDIIEDLFAEDKSKRRFARKHFSEMCFSNVFLKKHKVVFKEKVYTGNMKTAIQIHLAFGDYEYSIEVPCPENIMEGRDKENLVGRVKFRVDKLHNSQLKKHFREWVAVQMPTYDWKECFDAIEADVDKEESAKNAHWTKVQ